MTVRKHAPDTLVPVLLDDKEAVQGSSEIIDYIEQKHPSHSLTPRDADERRACLEIENTMDEKLGETIRFLRSQDAVYKKIGLVK